MTALASPFAFAHAACPMPIASRKAMRMYSGRSRAGSPISAKEVADRVVSYLQDRYPSKTAVAVSADTGIEASTVAKWLERGDIVPNGVAILRLTFAYGPEFLCALAAKPPTWLGRARAYEQEARARGELESALASFSRQRSALAALDADFHRAEIDRLGSLIEQLGNALADRRVAVTAPAVTGVK